MSQLDNQFKKYLGDDFNSTPELKNLYNSINQSYNEFKKKTDDIEVKELIHFKNEYMRFVDIISHDLASPLRSLNSLSSWIREDFGDQLGDEGLEQFVFIEEKVGRMNYMIKGLAKFAKLGANSEEIVDIDLNELILTDIAVSLDIPKEINVEIIKSLPVVRQKQSLIRCIFTELLRNAVKFRKQPKGIIEIDYKNAENTHIITIMDDGIGIEQKHYGRIFEIFQTLKPKDEEESPGIGLSLVRKSTQLIGGEIELESKINHGATFKLRIPYKGS